jgi:hypothetical protein
MLNLDDLDSTHPDLLCYLVVSHLAAYALTGRPMTIEHAVESAQNWGFVNGDSADSQLRLQVAHISMEVARRLRHLPFPGDEPSIARLFAGKWKLDHDAALVASIHRVCLFY